jgi:hypothetical protein
MGDAALATKDDDILTGHCPNCGPERFADVKAQYRTSFNDDEVGIWGHTDYRILSCRGCGAVYMQTSEIFSENVDHRMNSDGEWEQYISPDVRHFPAPSRRAKPRWHYDIDLLDSSLGSLFSDIYRCLDAELSVPAAVATRTAFDRATELLGIDPSESFSAKLDSLLSNGKISKDEKGILAVLIDAGSAAAHRGWRPKAEELDTLVSLVESFFHRTFVLGDAAHKLKAVVPPKPKRKKKT